MKISVNTADTRFSNTLDILPSIIPNLQLFAIAIKKLYKADVSFAFHALLSIEDIALFKGY